MHEASTHAHACACSLFARRMQEFVAKWQDRDETDNFFQKYDAELVKDDLRPLVFEEIRLQVSAHKQ